MDETSLHWTYSLSPTDTAITSSSNMRDQLVWGLSITLHGGLEQSLFAFLLCWPTYLLGWAPLATLAHVIGPTSLVSFFLHEATAAPQCRCSSTVDPHIYVRPVCFCLGLYYPYTTVICTWVYPRPLRNPLRYWASCEIQKHNSDSICICESNPHCI